MAGKKPKRGRPQKPGSNRIQESVNMKDQKLKNKKTNTPDSTMAPQDIPIHPVLLLDQTPMTEGWALDSPTARFFNWRCVKVQNTAGLIIFKYTQKRYTATQTSQAVAQSPPHHLREEPSNQMGTFWAGARGTSVGEERLFEYPLPPKQCYNYSTMVIPESELPKVPGYQE
ncbi:hypothetical protein VTK26DRAFT_5327 [Humicola hyalothermophila]